MRGADESRARELDMADPLARFRSAFHIPPRHAGRDESVYLCGHSLGLQPREVRRYLEQELASWAALAVAGHFQGPDPWYSYHELLRQPGARLVGALPDEIVWMNSLTVNLHLLLATFYQPTAQRHAIVIDEPAFPSDRYAVVSHLRHRGQAPERSLLTVGPRPGEVCMREEDVQALLRHRGHEIAVLLLNAVNFLTGQLLDVSSLTRAAQEQGIVVGWDLAHAAGNVPLALHEWGVDFAAWCGYKYLNGGPGCVAGVFIHQRHATNIHLPRLAGWWGNDPATRFRMHLQPDFVPVPTADGWQVSNPPVFALAPLRASLALFDEATMPALRLKSQALTRYLLELLDELPAGRCQVLTPREPVRRGCQLSLRLPAGADRVAGALERAGVVVDFRPPDVIRVAPVPLYNSFHDVWTFAQVLREML